MTSRPTRTGWPFDCAMWETGAQNCERDPFSDSASVVRCFPAAISRSSSALPANVVEAAIACTALTCMTNTIAVELQPWARASTTAAKARRPWPPPPNSARARTCRAVRARAPRRSRAESGRSCRPRARAVSGCRRPACRRAAGKYRQRDHGLLLTRDVDCQRDQRGGADGRRESGSFDVRMRRMTVDECDDRSEGY